MSQAAQIISHTPPVYTRDGEVLANSEDVASYFGKRHADVLRSIDNLDCSAEFRERNFALTTKRRQVGSLTREIRSFDMTKDGFTFLAMGFTGREAAAFKEAYIAEFNRMRLALTAPTSTAQAFNLDDEQHLVELSAALLGKNRELKARAERAEHLVEIARPAVELQKRIEASALSICLQDAGRLLEIGANKGIDLMANAGWLFRKAGRWTAKAVYVERGWLEHKIYEGGSFTSIQPRVTGLGLLALSKLVGKPITQIDAFNMIEGARRQGLLTSN